MIANLTNIPDTFNICGIYSIKNIVNGKQYIGKSKNIQKRLKQHIYYYKKNSKDENRHLKNAFNKYGLINFECLILETLNKDEQLLKQKELEYIISFNTLDRKLGYNLRLDTATSCIVSEETKELHRKNSKGANNPNFGNKWSDEQKAHLSKLRKSKFLSGEYIISQEQKDKISKSSSLLWKDEDKKRKMALKLSEKKTKFKIAQCKIKTNEILHIYNSVKEVINLNPEYKWQNIYSVCNGYKKAMYGYSWKKIPIETNPPFSDNL